MKFAPVGGANARTDRRCHHRGRSRRTCGRRVREKGRLELRHSRKGPEGRFVVASSLRAAAFTYGQATVLPALRPFSRRLSALCAKKSDDRISGSLRREVRFEAALW